MSKLVSKAINKYRIFSMAAIFGLAAIMGILSPLAPSTSALSLGDLGSHSFVKNGAIFHSGYWFSNDDQTDMYSSYLNSSVESNHIDSATVSPSGQRIAYIYQNGFSAPITQGIFISTNQFTQPKQIYSLTSSNLALGIGDISWSPDGQWLAFNYASSVDGTAKNQTAIVRPNGNDLRFLGDTDLSNLTNGVAWSGDSQNIVYVKDATANNPSSLCQFNLATDQETCNSLATPTGSYVTSIAVEPVSDTVALAVSWDNSPNPSSDTTQSDIYTVNLTGGNLKQLTQQSPMPNVYTSRSNLLWSPDGSKLLYQKNVNTDTTGKGSFTNTFGLYTYDLASKTEKLLADKSYASSDTMWLPKITCITSPFSDVPASSIFCPAIDWAVNKGITTGTSQSQFSPTAPVTRATMAAYLYRLDQGSSALPTCSTSRFSDVPTSNIFCGAINWMADKGITTGYPDGTFHPAETVTRAQFSAFLYRYANHTTSTSIGCDSSSFTDVPTTNQFCGSIEWLVKNQITSGTTATTFDPTGAVTRQAAMTFLYRYSVY